MLLMSDRRRFDGGRGHGRGRGNRHVAFHTSGNWIAHVGRIGKDLLQMRKVTNAFAQEVWQLKNVTVFHDPARVNAPLAGQQFGVGVGGPFDRELMFLPSFLVLLLLVARA